MIAHSIKACQASARIGRIIVSTEDEEIAAISKHYGAEVPFLRPAELSKDESPDLGVLEHFFSQIDVSEVAFIRPTTPIRNPKTLDDAIAVYYGRALVQDATGLRSMHALPESPYKFFKINADGFCVGLFEDFEGIKDYADLPRQRFPVAYHPNGYIDIIKKSTVDGGSTYGEKISPYVTESVIEIDTQEQFNLLELHFGKGQEK